MSYVLHSWPTAFARPNSIQFSVLYPIASQILLYYYYYNTACIIAPTVDLARLLIRPSTHRVQPEPVQPDAVQQNTRVLASKRYKMLVGNKSG